MTAMMNKYGDGLAILAFPCDQFGGQELKTAAEIKAFVADKFAFPGTLMEKCDVNGPNTHPVWKYLKAESGDDSNVRWNFACNFLIDKNGAVVERNGDGAGASEGKIAELLKA
jgi:glutathione peroxidase-family protein